MKRAKLILITLVIMLATILLSTIDVNATLQANGKKVKTATPDKWISEFRNMEKQGEGMGLSETLKSDLSAESPSNNIDVHMVKSTEFGAVAILSASAYGNSQTLPNSEIKTTTGNNTGVYFSGEKWEYVAMDFRNNYNALVTFKEVNGKYFNIYTSNVSESAKVGDALGNKSSTNPGCDGWHKSTGVYIYHYGSPVARGGKGLFSAHYYDSAAPASIVASGDFPAQNSYSRGVAVCGEGL